MRDAFVWHVVALLPLRTILFSGGSFGDEQETDAVLHQQYERYVETADIELAEVLGTHNSIVKYHTQRQDHQGVTQYFEIVHAVVKRVRSGLPQDGNAGVYFKAAGELFLLGGRCDFGKPLLEEARLLFIVETSVNTAGLIRECEQLITYCIEETSKVTHLPDMIYTIEALTEGTLPLPETKDASTSASYLVHTWWHGEVDREAVLVVKSALAVKQTIDSLKFVFWLDSPSYDSQMLRPSPYFLQLQGYRQHVEIRRWNFAIEMQSTPLSDVLERALLKWRQNQWDDTPQLAYLSDIARIVILYKYGGLWVDNDFVFLRDYEHLFNMEFVGYIYSGINNAIMHLRPASRVSTDLITAAAKELAFGPHDGFSRFSLSYVHPDSVILPTRSVEMPETVSAGSFRVGCRWYEAYPESEVQFFTLRNFTGVENQFALHTHNECNHRIMDELSPAAFFEKLFERALCKRAQYCSTVLPEGL